jgi:hypothetical protein
MFTTSTPAPAPCGFQSTSSCWNGSAHGSGIGATSCGLPPALQDEETIMWKKYAFAAMIIAGYVAITTTFIAASADEYGIGFTYGAVHPI